MLGDRGVGAALLAGVVFCAGGVAGSASAGCTPAQFEAARTVAPIVQQIGCILIRALSPGGRLDEVCATAEDLAPFVPEILAARESRGTVTPSPGPILAFSFSVADVPRVTRRRCVSWAPIASFPDGGTFTDGGDGGR